MWWFTLVFFWIKVHSYKNSCPRNSPAEYTSWCNSNPWPKIVLNQCKYPRHVVTLWHAICFIQTQFKWHFIVVVLSINLPNSYTGFTIALSSAPFYFHYAQHHSAKLLEITLASNTTFMNDDYTQLYVSPVLRMLLQIRQMSFRSSKMSISRLKLFIVFGSHGQHHKLNPLFPVKILLKTWVYGLMMTCPSLIMNPTYAEAHYTSCMS